MLSKITLFSFVVLVFYFAIQAQAQDRVQDSSCAIVPSASQSTVQTPQEFTNNNPDHQEILPIKYTGNLVSKIFHRPHCPYALCMGVEKRCSFQFRYQAIDSGFVPCRYCLPPVCLKVKAKIITNK